MDKYKMLLLLNQTWVHFPVHNKANLLTLGWIEKKNKKQKTTVYFRASSQRSQQLVLKAGLGEGGCEVHDQLMDILLIGCMNACAVTQLCLTFWPP